MQSDRLVLVVSGDSEERERAVSAVLDLGHAVLCADTGEQALAVLAENPSIDVVVVDVAAGPDVAGRMQERRPDAAVFHSGVFLDWVAAIVDATSGGAAPGGFVDGAVCRPPALRRERAA